MFTTVCVVSAAVIALVFDGILSAHFNSLDTCIGDDGSVYGETNSMYAYICRADEPDYTCVCNDGNSCYGFDLKSVDDCGMLLDEVPSRLGMSALFALICAILMTVYSCMACGVSCCPDSCGHYDPEYAKMEEEAQANPTAL